MPIWPPVTPVFPWVPLNPKVGGQSTFFDQTLGVAPPAPPAVTPPAPPEVTPPTPPTVPPVSPPKGVRLPGGLRFYAERAPYVDWEWLASVMQSSRPFPWSPFEIAAVALQSVGRARRAAENDLRAEYRDVLSQAAQMPEEVRSQYLEEAVRQIREKAAALGVRPPVHVPMFRVETAPLGEVDKAYVDRMVQTAISSGATPEQARALAESLAAMPIRVYKTTDGRTIPSSADLSELRRRSVEVTFDLVRNARVPVTLPDGTTMRVSPEAALNYHIWAKSFGRQEARDAIDVISRVQEYIFERIKAGDTAESALEAAKGAFSGALDKLGINTDMFRSSTFWKTVADGIRRRIEREERVEGLREKAAEAELEMKKMQMRYLPQQIERELEKSAAEVRLLEERLKGAPLERAATLTALNEAREKLNAWREIRNVFSREDLSDLDKMSSIAPLLFGINPTAAIQLLGTVYAEKLIPTEVASNIYSKRIEDLRGKVRALGPYEGAKSVLGALRSGLELARSTTSSGRASILFSSAKILEGASKMDFSGVGAEQRRELLRDIDKLIEEMKVFPGMGKEVVIGLTDLQNTIKKQTQSPSMYSKIVEWVMQRLSSLLEQKPFVHR